MLQSYQSYHLANRTRIIEQARFNYSALGKAFEKQTNATEDQGKKQVNALKDLQPKDEEEKQMEAIKELLRERMGKLYNKSEQKDFTNLTYCFKSKCYCFQRSIACFQEMIKH